MNIKRNVLTSALAALMFTLATATASTPAKGADLTVDVKNVGDKGEVMIALYKVGDKWLGRSSFGTIVPAKGDISVSFKDLPEGEYAVSLFVDQNSNKKMDTNPIGIPIEPYAFSNDAAGTFGPPSFEQAKFSVGKDSKSIVIAIK